MRVGVGLPSTIPGCRGATLIAWARRAETGPFTSVAELDRVVYDAYDPFVALAATAAVTTRIRLATNSAIARKESDVSASFTLRAMDQELVSDSLVYRYNPSASPDGLQGHEGTFSIATYWYVDALARSGRLEEARLTFEKMATYANHLGLFSEQIGLTGGQQGNFPQAFTHLALINAAMNLNYQLDHGAGRVGLNELIP